MVENSKNAHFFRMHIIVLWEDYLITILKRDCLYVDRMVFDKLRCSKFERRCLHPSRQNKTQSWNVGSVWVLQLPKSHAKKLSSLKNTNINSVSSLAWYFTHFSLFTFRILHYFKYWLINQIKTAVDWNKVYNIFRKINILFEDILHYWWKEVSPLDIPNLVKLIIPTIFIYFSVPGKN